MAARSNGVSRLHGATSRELFHRLWPDLSVDEVPIGSITNGVHGRTWVSPRVDALLTRVVGDDWPGADAERWARVGEIEESDLSIAYTKPECLEGRNWYRVFEDPEYDARVADCSYG